MVHVNYINKILTRRQKYYAKQILASLFSSLILKQIGIAPSDIDSRLHKGSTRCIPIYAANFLDGDLNADQA